MHTDAILSLLQEVAAEVIDPRFRTLADGEISEKNPGDLVTVADHEAEELITRALRGAYPEAVILGEEAYAEDPSLLERYTAAEHAFTVDPVDGTRNFVHGSPDHSVMTAEVRRGEVTRAWIWQPQHRTAYVAERGAGAFRNGERIARDAPSAAPSSWRGVTSARRWVGRELPGMRPLELTWVACSVDYPMLATGHADYLVYRPGRSMPWDHAAGSLLLAEAGAHLGTFDGSAYDPRQTGAGLVGAADKATYDAVLDALRQRPDMLRRR